MLQTRDNAVAGWCILESYQVESMYIIKVVELPVRFSMM